MFVSFRSHLAITGANLRSAPGYGVKMTDSSRLAPAPLLRPPPPPPPSCPPVACLPLPQVSPLLLARGRHKFDFLMKNQCFECLPRPFSLSKGKLFGNYFSTLSKLMCLVGLHYCRENKSFMFQVGYAPVIVSILFLLLFSGKSRTAQLFGNCNYRRRLGCFTLCLRHNVSPRQLQSRIYVSAITQ